MYYKEGYLSIRMNQHLQFNGKAVDVSIKENLYPVYVDPSDNSVLIWGHKKFGKFSRHVLIFKECLLPGIEWKPYLQRYRANIGWDIHCLDSELILDHTTRPGTGWNDGYVLIETDHRVSNGDTDVILKEGGGFLRSSVMDEDADGFLIATSAAWPFITFEVYRLFLSCSRVMQDCGVPEEFLSDFAHQSQIVFGYVIRGQL